MSEGHTAGRLTPYDVSLLDSEKFVVAVAVGDVFKLNATANAARLALCWNVHDELVEALRPFADEAEFWPRGQFDDEHKMFNGDVTLADFRRALIAFRRATSHDPQPARGEEGR